MGVSRLLVWLLVLLVFKASSVTMDTQEDEWIDPYDMLNFDHSSVKMSGKTKQENNADPVKDDTTSQHPPRVGSEKTTFTGSSFSDDPIDKKDNGVPAIQEAIQSTDKGETIRESIKSPQKQSANSSIYKTLYRKHVRMLVDKWDSKAVSGDSILNFVLSFSPGDLMLLRTFAKNGEGNIHEIDDILQRMVLHVEPPVGINFNRGLLGSYIGVSLSTIIQILAVLALVSVIMWIELTLQISWRQKIIKLIFLSFFVSVPWTWYRMYKQEEAKQQSELMLNIPEACVKRKLSWYEMVAEVTRSMFTLSDDQCVKYYEQLLVDPMSKVAPTEAIAVTFVRFFLSPAKHVGQALSEFVKGTFQHLPVTLWPIMIICGMILIILILLFSFGYTIRLPFLLSIESSSSNVSKHRLEIMSTENTQHKKQIEELKDKLKEVEGDRLRLTYSLSSTLHGTHSDSSLRSLATSQNATISSQNHRTRISNSDHIVQSGGGLLPSRVQSIQPNFIVDEQEISKSIMYVKQDSPPSESKGQEQNLDTKVNKEDILKRESACGGAPENGTTEKQSGDVNNINASAYVNPISTATTQLKISEEHIQTLSPRVIPNKNGVSGEVQELSEARVTEHNSHSKQNVNDS